MTAGKGQHILAGVKVDGKDIEADVVVVAMGPWTKLAASWFEGIPRIGAQKAHSIVVEPQSEVTPDCLFLAHTNKQGQLRRPSASSKDVKVFTTCLKTSRLLEGK